MGVLLFGLGLLLASIFFGVFPVLLVLTGNWILDTVGIPIFVACVGIAILIFYAALVWFRGSLWKALIDLLEFGIVGVGWVVSKFATAIRRLGAIVSVMSWVKATLGLYPGRRFIENRREGIVERGIKHVESGDVEITDSRETLAQEAREAYDKAGRQLSNGEAVLGLSLAVVTLLPSNIALIPYSELLSSSAVAAGLSIALVLVVAIRLSALDLALARDPDPTENKARLAVYRDWNQTVAGGTDVVKVFVMLRVMYGISDSAYEFYIDWVFERNINGEGVGTVELIRELPRPVFAFYLAERDGISPSEASQEMFGWDVFSSFEFGPSEEESPPEDEEPYIFESALRPVIEFKHDIRDVKRATKARQLAEKRDSSPEEVSRELYGENILPATEETKSNVTEESTE
ncbi:hypothetical protein [Halovenus halobia]|uniref:hypothetical protein n=1 Tax=Halovenus halobia TaxID=3396622 RepID=UPI003F551B06